MRQTGIVLGHGCNASEWKGKLLTELAVILASQGACSKLSMPSILAECIAAREQGCIRRVCGHTLPLQAEGAEATADVRESAGRMRHITFCARRKSMGAGRYVIQRPCMLCTLWHDFALLNY